MTKLKRVNYHLTVEQVKKLKRISKSTGLSVAEIIRRAVDEYIYDSLDFKR